MIITEKNPSSQRRGATNNKQRERDDIKHHYLMSISINNKNQSNRNIINITIPLPIGNIYQDTLTTTTTDQV